jgi:uncharacterized protein (TIGR02145 family)
MKNWILFIFWGMSIFSSLAQNSPNFNNQGWQKFHAELDACTSDSVQYLGKWYHLVSIGNQCWFQENLNVGVFDSIFRNDTTIQKYCYGGLPSNCSIYGGLYDWDESHRYSTVLQVNQDQGICPIGWHISSGQDWFNVLRWVNPAITRSSFYFNNGGMGVYSTHVNIASELKQNSALWGNNRIQSSNSTQLSILPGYQRFGNVGYQCYHLNWRDFNTPESEIIELNGLDNDLIYSWIGDPGAICGIRCVKN